MGFDDIKAKAVVRDWLKKPLVARLASFVLPVKQVDSATWEQQYRDGTWHYLNDVNEMPRYAVIAGYVHSIRPNTILDVGCGTGNLANWVCRHDSADYLGIDLATVAIQRANKSSYPNARFEVANATQFEPNSRFDVIIFNEILYYIHAPDELLTRYTRFLNPKGVFIISMVRNADGIRAQRRCAAAIDVINAVRLRVGMNEWDIWLCHPHERDYDG